MIIFYIFWTRMTDFIKKYMHKTNTSIISNYARRFDDIIVYHNHVKFEGSLAYMDIYDSYRFVLYLGHTPVFLNFQNRGMHPKIVDVDHCSKRQDVTFKYRVFYDGYYDVNIIFQNKNDYLVWKHIQRKFDN